MLVKERRVENSENEIALQKYNKDVSNKFSLFNIVR